MVIDETYPKGLALDVLVENPAYFKEPFRAKITYRRAALPWAEQICAENADNQYAVAASPPIPKALKPDF